MEKVKSNNSFHQMVKCGLGAIIEHPISVERALLTAYVSGPVRVHLSMSHGRYVSYWRGAAPGVFNGMNILGYMIFAICAAAPGDTIHHFT